MTRGYARRHQHADLLAHVRRVNRFGGRENVDAKIKDAVLSSNLGGSHTYDTTSVIPSEKIVVLCEMSLPKAIPVDVVFSLPNRRIDPDGGARLADDPTTTNFSPLDAGSGFVRITWGSAGGQVQVVDVDAAHGWRYPFVASYVSVEYHPVDRTQWIATPEGTNGPMIGSQPRNMKVAASIVPGSSIAPVYPLTKTMFYPDLAGLGSSDMVVPSFAKNAEVSFRNGVAAILSVYEWILPSGVLQSIGGSRTNSSAGGWPTWRLYEKFSVPQRAGFLRVTSSAAGSPMQNLSVKYELGI